MTITEVNYFPILLKKYLADPSQLTQDDLKYLEAENFLNYLEQQQALSLIAHNVCKYKNYILPVQFETRRNKLSAMKILLEHQLDKIFKDFCSRNIKVIELKGSSLSKLLYEDPELRDSGDLDLLIPTADYQKVSELLNDLDFESQIKQNKFCQKIDHLTNHSYEFICQTSGINIDLHFHLAERYYVSRQFTFDFWETAEDSSDSTTSNIYLANTYYLLIFLCIQAFKEDYQRILRLNEIRILSSKQRLDKIKLSELADKYDLALLVKNTLQLVEDFFEGKKILPNRQSEALKLFKLHQRFTSKLNSLFFRYLMPFGDDFKKPLPAALIFLYFPIKYLRICIRACKALQTSFRKR